MKKTKDEESDQRIRFAPTEFYDNCDDCGTLPEERWEDYRKELQEGNQHILQDRRDVNIFFLFK